MSVLINTLREEFQTVKRLEQKYLKNLKALPQGSFIIRKVGKKQYGYLTRREAGAVRQVYLGSLDEKEVEKYRNLMKQRRLYRDQLKSVREQKKILERALRGKTTRTRH